MLLIPIGFPDYLAILAVGKTILLKKCVVAFCREELKCPHPGCSSSVPPNSETIQLFEAILSEMFHEYEAVYTPPAPYEPEKEVLNITVLNGDATQIPYDPKITMPDVRTQIQKKLKIPPTKQKILFEDKEVEFFNPNGLQLTLSDLKIPPNATLYLVVLLYEIPEAFNHVIFDLHWGYPSSGKDFLDASCLVYTGTEFLSVVDFRRTYDPIGITHSGDVMDNVNQIGHHTIRVALKTIPSNVTHLFFTLSAWRCPNIARYPNPSLKFYEASNTKTDLCKTTFTHAGNSQAVVMCSVSKNSQGKWDIFESGELSPGNAIDYEPLKRTISNLIQTGY